MRFAIEHEIRYAYSRPVFLEPQVVRLEPRCDAAQEVAEHLLEVEPEPAGRTRTIDVGGHPATVLWFAGLTERLVIRARSVVEAVRSNPFDFIVIDEGALSVPAAYREELRDALAPYLRRREASADVDGWAREAAAASGGDTLRFLPELTARIARDFETVRRPDGPPFPPAKTLATRKGACRDLAVLFMDAVRSLGLAARFVSGYKAEADPGRERELHAWAEVFVPGGGWRGFDPSLGLATADEHVALAAGAEPAAAAPVSGTFRGTGARSELTYRVEIRCDGRGG